MKPFPHLILFVTAAAGYALPISAAASGTLLFVAGVSAIITIDYGQRYRGLPTPRQAPVARRRAKTPAVFHAPPLQTETNRLAA